MVEMSVSGRNAHYGYCYRQFVLSGLRPHIILLQWQGISLSHWPTFSQSADSEDSTVLQTTSLAYYTEYSVLSNVQSSSKPTPSKLHGFVPTDFHSLHFVFDVLQIIWLLSLEIMVFCIVVLQYQNMKIVGDVTIHPPTLPNNKTSFKITW